jgi:hypothetical protein
MRSLALALLLCAAAAPAGAVGAAGTAGAASAAAGADAASGDRERAQAAHHRLPRPVRLARNHAAHSRGLRASEVRVVRYGRRTWPDGCLGLGGPDLVCTQALVDGYRAVFDVRGKRVVYRTDLHDTYRVER